MQFLYRSILGSKIAIQVVFFVWIIALRMASTVDGLIKGNIIMVDWSCICKCKGEAIDHLLLHCKVAREFWSSIFATSEVTLEMP
jgi:hypothetical protein